jgi:hypothetical protein
MVTGLKCQSGVSGSRFNGKTCQIIQNTENIFTDGRWP